MPTSPSCNKLLILSNWMEMLPNVVGQDRDTRGPLPFFIVLICNQPCCFDLLTVLKGCLKDILLDISLYHI
jgi:hypothetical protein